MDYTRAQPASFNYGTTVEEIIFQIYSSLLPSPIGQIPYRIHRFRNLENDLPC